MTDPLAFLLTWTCYGTWLHGDPHGSVAPGHNAPGTETLPPNPARQRFEQRRMESAPSELTPAGRRVVAETLAAHARSRGWELLAANVRSNHVHVVVAYAGLRPEKMLAEFKAWCTRRLREAGLALSGNRTWTRHGSTRYLWDARSVNAAIAYVVEGQDVAR
jgi:REP element-mobilizing transposase RayT